MSAPVNRRQWLVSTSLAAGSSVLLPKLLPAMGAERLPAASTGSYHDTPADGSGRTRPESRWSDSAVLHENPFACRPRRKKRHVRMVGHSRYDLRSEPNLRNVFAKHVGVDPSYVLITQGSSETLSIAALAYGSEGGEIVVPWPTFEGLPNYADSIGARVHKVPLDANLGHDFEKMDTHITNAVDLVFVCNPNNPTSTLADNARIRSFVSATQHKAMVVVDEAYHDFVDEPSYKPMIDLVLKGENVIVSRTASKIHGIAGLRVGFAIARPDIIARLERFVTGNPNSFGLQAAAASLQDTAHQDFIKARNREGRALLTTTLKGLGKRVAPSQTNLCSSMPTCRWNAFRRP
jgi:histidinol-phosphate aminotransferase